MCRALRNSQILVRGLKGGVADMVGLGLPGAWEVVPGKWCCWGYGLQKDLVEDL